MSNYPAHVTMSNLQLAEENFASVFCAQNVARVAFDGAAKALELADSDMRSATALLHKVIDNDIAAR